MKEQRYITLPEDWDELTEADWREALKIRQTMAETDHAWTVEDARIETARAMLKNRGVSQQINNPKWLKLVGDVAQSLTWLWTVEGEAISLCYRSVANRLPMVHQWLGPMDCGADITFGEFRQAVSHLKIYEQDQNPKALAALAGLLYRPAATEEQRTRYDRQLRRQPYDWDSLDEKIRRGEQMKPWQRWGIYAWMAYFCEALTTETFIVEGEEVCFAPLFEHPTPNPSPQRGGESGGLHQICLTLAESHVFGTAKDVDHTLLMNVMQKLLMDYHALMKLKKVKETKGKKLKT